MRFLILLLSVVILASCAKVGSPSGGEKDTTPPKIVSASPANFSTNVNPKQIEITFDEFVKLGNYQSEWIVSPTLKEKPEAKLRGKKLIISLPDSLEENTTYIFNFAGTIGDLHEGNELEEKLFVFSTGAALDSGMVSGNTMDAQKDEPLGKTAVGLFSTNDSNNFPPNYPPKYYAQSNDVGGFEFNYIKENNYWIIAWVDANKNKIVEPEEQIGFLGESIKPWFVKKQDSLKLRLFSNPPDTLISSKQKLFNNRRAVFSFNKEIAEDSLQVLADEVAFVDYFKDSLAVWFKQEQLGDSLIINLKGSTINQRVKMYPIEGINKRESNKLRVINTLSPKKTSDSLFLVFSEPPVSDSIPVELFNEKDSSWTASALYRSTISNQFYFINQAPLGKTVVIKGPTVEGIYNHISDTLTLNYTLPSKEALGNLVVRTTLNQTFSGTPVFYFGIKGKMRHFPYHSGKLDLKQLSAGQYDLFLIFDEDGNGKYSPGNAGLRQQPERVIKYPGAIDIRSNWDLELEWVIPSK
ncbi:Ig-like domain-containing protein [Luteibaculum oceani]|uniref:SbsA Ig-like domain-containing protein n=1 Tax=Luteibaculum oceani TaxID=1294296 RepID=A0A5C6V1U5_9FLAO|nr:Ig-like domain-containing protein [Luteibaculum oceani]TXC78984.1 hypothetical protein FRX97_07150 [Luteibaculum oceani]